MTNIWKSDLYRLGKSKLLYGIVAVTSIIALSLMLMIRQDIRLGISIFGDLTAFKSVDDIIRLGVQYHKGLGIFAAILITVFIGQEYSWKTWQNKWITNKSRSGIYLSKAALSAAASVVIFLLFQTVAVLCSGNIQGMFTGGYALMILCGSFIYAALGTVLCMLSMLIRSNIASVIVCIGYVMLGETLASVIRNIGNLSDSTAKISEWVVGHTIYGMSSALLATSFSTVSILSILINSAAIAFLSTEIGMFLFRKYEL